MVEPRRLPPSPAPSESAAAAGTWARTTRHRGPLLIPVRGVRTTLAALEIALNSLRHAGRPGRGVSCLSAWPVHVVPVATFILLPSVAAVSIYVPVAARV